jgi:multidrug resistance efflux pump
MTLHAKTGAPRLRVGAVIILIVAVLGLAVAPTANAVPKQTLRHQLQTLKKKNRQLRHNLAAARRDLAQARHDLGGRPSRKSIDEQIQGLRGYLGGRGSIMNRALVLAENHRRLKVRYAALKAESDQAAAVIGGSGTVSVRARQALSRVPGSRRSPLSR